MATCYLHIGTHKTATTYIQTFLASNDVVLLQDGLLIPKTGRIAPTSGYLNLAWQLNGDERYEACHGSLDELCAELTAAKAERICLSGEDFEYLDRSPEAMLRLAGCLSSLGSAMKVIV